MKRAIQDNVGPNGHLNTDNIVSALLQYRNTPLKNVSLSPAQLLLGRNLRDSIPQLSTAYRVSPQWEANIRERERSMATEQQNSKEYHDSQPTRNYNQLAVGQTVSCQNVKNKKWDRTGTIVEVNQFRQYKVKMHGSGRISLRNRIHLKPLLHVKSPLSHLPNTNNKPVSTPSTQTIHPAMDPQDERRATDSTDNLANAEATIRRSRRDRREIDRYGEWIYHGKRRKGTSRK